MTRKRRSRSTSIGTLRIRLPTSANVGATAISREKYDGGMM